jgi:TP901 family phage tail tape measure protein
VADLTTSIKISVLDAFSGPMKQLGLELTDVDKKLGKLGHGWERHAKIAGELNQAAEGMGRFGDVVVASLKKPIEDFASFDAALARVSAKTGEMRGSTGFEALKKQAEDLGAATKYSAEQVAQAQAEFAASGRNTREILQSLPSTLSLATAGNIDLAQATQYTNETLNQFRLGAEKTAFVQNVLARADEVSAASITDLGEAFSYAGSTLASLNVPVQQGAAYLAILADGGLKASRGGTSFQAMLSRLKSPSQEATKALHAFGFSQKGILDLQKQISTGQFEAAFTSIARAAEKLSPEKRTALMTDVFGMEGERAANILLPKVLDDGEKGLKSYLRQFEKVDGAVDRTAKTMEESLAGSLERAGGALSGLSTQLGEVLAPTVKSLSRSVEDGADVASKLAKEYPEATLAALELIGAMAALALGLKAVLLTQSAYHGGLAALGRTYTAMSGSLLGSAGLIAAVGLAGYAIGQWANETFGLADKFSDAMGRAGPKLDKQQGIQASDDQEYPDGTVVSGKSGTVIRVGTKDPSMAPAFIREARAAGATSLDEINAFVNRRKERNALPAAVSPLSNEAVDEGFSVAPSASRGPPPLLAGAGTKEQTDALLRASADQTAELARKAEEHTKAVRELLEEQRRANRKTEMGAFSPYANGAF